MSSCNPDAGLRLWSKLILELERPRGQEEIKTQRARGRRKIPGFSGDIGEILKAFARGRSLEINSSLMGNNNAAAQA